MPNPGKRSQKQCVPGSMHPNWRFLGLRVNLSWRERVWNHFNIRKKNPICNPGILWRKHVVVLKMDHMKGGQQPTESLRSTVFQVFTIIYCSLPSWRGNVPVKIVLPPKMRPIAFILFKANSFWFPPSSDPGVAWGHCLLQTLSSKSAPPSFRPKPHCGR